jgi:hypothetical protein
VIFGAPNTMNETTIEGMHMGGMVLSSLAGLEYFYDTVSPALKRWAIISRINQ